jgi:hypothetical protein
MPHFGAFAGVVEGLLAVQQAPTADPCPGCSAGSQKGDKREEGGRRLFGLWSWWDMPATVPMRPGDWRAAPGGLRTAWCRAGR